MLGDAAYSFHLTFTISLMYKMRLISNYLWNSRFNVANYDWNWCSLVFYQPKSRQPHSPVVANNGSAPVINLGFDLGIVLVTLVVFRLDGLAEDGVTVAHESDLDVPRVFRAACKLKRFPESYLGNTVCILLQLWLPTDQTIRMTILECYAHQKMCNIGVLCKPKELEYFWVR